MSREDEGINQDRDNEEDPWVGLEEDEDDEELRLELAKRRKRIRSAVVVVLVAALIGNILAFWPKIYNMETLPFLFKSKQLSVREDIQQYKEAVVLVSTDKGKGTGFHVSNGYIVTNYHVIDDGAYSLVSFPGSSDSYKAEVAAAAPDVDIAILRIDAEGRELPHIELEREAGWQAGDQIYIIGNPLYFTQIANVGTVLNMVPVSGKQKPVLALDAPVFKGNSGSPVINERGKAIAVVYATGEVENDGETMQAGFAIPLEDWIGLLQGLSLGDQP